MNKDKIMAKLDTYIKEYSKLLTVNSELKIKLEQEKHEKELLIEKIEKCKQVVTNSTELVKKTISKAEIIEKQAEQYKEDIINLFDEINSIIELIADKENFSNEDIEGVKEKLNKIKEKIKPIER